MWGKGGGGAGAAQEKRENVSFIFQQQTYNCVYKNKFSSGHKREAK